jgi:two-component system OmpR family response regulator
MQVGKRLVLKRHTGSASHRLKILLVEDDAFLSNGLRMALQDAGYTIDHTADGSAAVEMLSATTYDLVILDLNLPGTDGLEILSTMRKKRIATPVLILSARSGLSNRVAGLDAGANDYLTKPFELPELEARIRALLRKEHWGNMTEIVHGDLCFDTINRTITMNNSNVELSAREITVLEILLKRAGRLVKKEMILDELANIDLEPTYNALDILIHRLRKKLDRSQCSIKTIRGLGYVLDRT